ncbi:MAG: GNAT family N-acetyltransferase [Actinomycetota bacterium]|nr:GNAT family N-acetyltransferase [Actinomycetota bacterium]
MTTAPVRLRPAVADDDAALLAIYASTRAEELAPLPWTDEQKATFVTQQYRAQAADYRQRHPGADFLVIERDGVVIGRLYRTRLEGGEIRVLDIALLGEHCGQGIGSALLRDVMAEANHEQVLLSLHVEFWNPALRLYHRLGFVEAARSDVHVRMEYRPGTPGAGVS